MDQAKPTTPEAPEDGFDRNNILTKFTNDVRLMIQVLQEEAQKERQELIEENKRTMDAKQKGHESDMESAKSAFEMKLAALESQMNTHQQTHEKATARLTDQFNEERTRLEKCMATLQGDSDTQLQDIRQEHETAIDNLKHEHENVIADLRKTYHEDVLREGDVSSRNTTDDQQGHTDPTIRIWTRFILQEDLEDKKDEGPVPSHWSIGKTTITHASGDDVYTCDRVFSETESTNDIFQQLKEQVGNVLHGEHVMIFGFGRSGSGKSTTFFGAPRKKTPTTKLEKLGSPSLIDLVVKHIFKTAQSGEDVADHSFKPSPNMARLCAKMHGFEVYNQSLYCLTWSKEKAHSVEITNMQGDFRFKIKGKSGAKAQVVWKDKLSEDLVFKKIREADRKRVTDETENNGKSSRGHGWFEVRFYDEESDKLRGIVTFFDLAGTEECGDAPRRDVSSALLAELNHLRTFLCGNLKRVESKFMQGIFNAISGSGFYEQVGRPKVIVLMHANASAKEEGNTKKTLKDLREWVRIQKESPGIDLDNLDNDPRRPRSSGSATISTPSRHKKQNSKPANMPFRPGTTTAGRSQTPVSSGTISVGSTTYSSPTGSPHPRTPTPSSRQPASIKGKEKAFSTGNKSTSSSLPDRQQHPSGESKSPADKQDTKGRTPENPKTADATYL